MTATPIRYGSTHLRVLVTGSRDWDHVESVEQIMRLYLQWAVRHGQRLLVMHGDAANGADNWVDRWCKHAISRGWPVDVHREPAKWGDPCVAECRPGHRQVRATGRDYCPFAGYRRNQVMVDRGADVCVAFWRAGSAGTKDCRKRAVDAGISELTILWSERESASRKCIEKELMAA